MRSRNRKARPFRRKPTEHCLESVMETCTKTNKRRGQRSREAGLMMKRVEPFQHVEKWALNHHETRVQILVGRELEILVRRGDRYYADEAWGPAAEAWLEMRA
ncbi:uncharacterized protein HKW66_Vig0067320 [Vigna angularis]|uniref:Uncharacterized protein n=1 Tax=Phaseolus angularis TaxID=3914 RepID=A0A8T0KAQ1_PHAAN|nr:uncharacterized protein HKW66_Vig0067320 [Vigna angularis]